jgi:hypothetical protein
MAIKIRDVELKQIPAKQLERHPHNPKIHGEGQRSALRAVLGEIGFVGAMIVRPLKRNRYQVLDGHGRLEEFSPDELVPCLVVKGLSDAEAAKLIATYDTVGDLAEIDPELLQSLTEGLEWNNAELSALVDEALAEGGAFPEGEKAPAAGARHVEFEAEDETAAIVETYRVLVTCTDEEDQTAFLEQMAAANRKCRVLNS